MTDRFRALALTAGLLLAGCGGEGDGPTGPVTPVLTSISVAPSSVTLAAIGEVRALAATPLDQQGREMEGITFSWSSSNESVATVDADGLVTATGNGSASITAAASGRQGSATISVSQTSDAVAVEPPEANFAAPGVQIQFQAVAVDANGHPLAPELFTWNSTDTDVVTVSPAGLATAQSLGSAAIRAEVGEAGGEAQVTVEPGQAPFVVSVSPDPLVEGEPATLSGGNFHPSPGGNVVRVDGVAAEVTAASEELLQIVVPTFDCRPTRPVQVTVTAGGETTPPRPALLVPGESGIELGVGEHRLIEDPDAFCLRFDAALRSEAYLIGVQSTSDAVASVTDVRVTSTTAAGAAGGLASEDPAAGAAAAGSARAAAAAAAGPVLSLSPTLGGHRGPDGVGRRDPGGVVPETPERWRLHREAEVRLRAWEREVLFRPGGPRPLDPRAPARSLAPSGSPLPAGPRAAADAPVARVAAGEALPGVGDVVTVRVPRVLSNNLCSSFEEVDTVVRVVGARGIWLEDPENPENGFTAADFQDLSDQFDAHIYETNREYVGDPTDLDGNARILIVVSREVNRLPGLLGFVFSGDFFPRSDCASSDEGEIFYGRAPDPTGQAGVAYPVGAARLDYPLLIAHELSHVIQVGRRLDQAASLMDSWMMEAQATLLEEAVGHAATGRSPGNDYGHAVAYNPSGTDPIFWYRNAFNDMTRYFGFQGGAFPKVDGAPEQCGWLRSNPSPCIARPLWYGVGWSFLRWISDQYGPDHAGGEAGLHRALVDGELTGFDLLTSVTGDTKARMLAWWAATLYADGRVSGGEPRLGKTSWNLRDIFDNLPATARLEPLTLAFTDFQATGLVRAGSAGYLRLQGPARPETAVRVGDGGGQALPGSMQVWVVRLE